MEADSAGAVDASGVRVFTLPSAKGSFVSAGERKRDLDSQSIFLAHLD